MEAEIKEYEVLKFKKDHVIEKRGTYPCMNIEMKEKFENIEGIKMRELQKTFKIYQKIIKELIEENKKKEKKIENLLNENAALKGENRKEVLEKFRDSSSFSLEENDSSRNILIQNDSFGLARKNFNLDFFKKPAMKITHEEVDQETILCRKGNGQTKKTKSDLLFDKV